MGHQIGPVEREELDTLMKEYPDWAESHPDIARELHQPRFHKNRKYNQQGNARVMPRRSATVPVSNYQAKYQPHAPRPRSSKKPPQTPIEMHPMPMNFATTQASDYITKDPSVRPGPIIQPENIERSDGAFEGKTSYGNSYPAHEIKPFQSQHPHPSITDGQMKSRNRQQQQPKFSSNTTNKDTYKRWQTKPALVFTELPTFTGSILYPDQSQSHVSTTKNTYQGQQTERVGLIKHSHGHIVLDGEHDMNTTSKSTYQGYENARPAEKIVRQPQLPVRHREPFQSKSQNQTDYGSCYSKGAPIAARAIQPHPETIELRFNNKTHFTTEQSSNYSGIDVTAHPPPRAIKPQGETYTSGEGKCETKSRSQTDYGAHDVRQAYVPAVKPIDESQRRGQLPKFNSETSNRHFYQPWQVEPRKRYVDFHEGHKYIPPMDKFTAVSTTKTTYIGAPGDTAETYMPLENHAMRGEGKIDFNTMYKSAFNNDSPLRKLNKDQMGKLLGDLRRRKHQEQQFTEKSVMFAQGVGSM